MIRRGTALALLLCLTLPLSSLQAQAPAAADKPMLGFTAEHATAQRALEARFDAKLDAKNLDAWLKRLSARPHHLGSAYDHDNAEFLASLYKSWGYDTAIEEFQVLFPTPKTRLIELTAPEHFTASLAEKTLAEDPTSGQSAEQLPTFNAYSIDGDVTGDLVYVNYGVPKDYEELERRGIDLKGKIAIARYGQSWRGIKPKVAAEHGAIGCIIYSDPHDDGYFQGDVYPKGAWRNENGAQRGSVMDMPQYPGDPLTPGVGATKDAKRLDRKDVTVFTKIPVLPISYADALPLLRALGGPVAPAAWRGGLPITYHLGSGPARVHIKLEFDWKLVPAYDVIAKLAGSERPDQWVLRGNHHDAWVNGAEDPLSGQVAMLEEARAIGELAKSGARPRRTIVFASWDGEEEGLLGSTEWAETHGDQLKKNAVVYINSDTNGRGFLQVEGSHTLERLVNEVGREVVDPERKISVLDRARAVELTGSDAETRKELRERKELRIGALGSGSDYSAFLQHLGIAALNIGYGGEDGNGIYHSIYDSYAHYTKFVDPGFTYGIVQAKTGGRLVLRMANADVLPMEFTNLAETVGRYAKQVMTLAETTRGDIEERNRQINEGTLLAAADPSETYVVPKTESAAPYLDFAPLQNAVARLQASAREFDRATAGGVPVRAEAQAALDHVLMGMEHALTRSEGLPRRPWYAHYVYAPGQYTGYGVKTLPAVREAIEQKQWSEANAQIVIVAGVLEGYAKEIDRASALARP